MFISFQKGYSISVVPLTYTSYFFTEFQKDYISSNYPTAFNGSAIRLENIERHENGTVSLSCSPLDFYSFLTSNLVVNPMEITSDTLDNYLSCPYLANVLAVSVLIYDSESILLVNRGSTVSLSPNSVGVSATGGVTLTDLKSSDCLRSAVQTEVQEELGLSISFTDITVSGLYISKDKLQPVAICFVEVSDLTSSTDTTRFHLDYFTSEILDKFDFNQLKP